MKKQQILIIVLQLILHNLPPLVNAAKPTSMKTQSQIINTIKPLTKQPIQQQQQKPEQKLEEKEKLNNGYATNKDLLNDISKSINIENELNNYANNWLNDFKNEPSNFMPWNPYLHEHPHSNLYNNYSPLSSLAHTPKFLPFFGVPQPIFIPYPLFMPPEMLYSNSFETNQLNEDNMSRTANIRHPSLPLTNSNNFQRNSPIYYVRLPPTPYMFVPGLSYPPTSTSSFAPILPYPSLPTLHALPISSMLNLPLNFLANGKPNGIYRIDSTQQDIQSQFPFENTRPTSFTGSYRPMLPQHAAPPYTFTSSNAPQQESKLTALKRPFMFNGRPDDIYILPNSYNPLYPDGSFF